MRDGLRSALNVRYSHCSKRCWVPVSSVSFSQRHRDLSESAKDNIRSRIAFTVQSASMPDNNLTKGKQQALKRLKNDNNTDILPAYKGLVTVVMDKTDYFDKTYECDKEALRSSSLVDDEDSELAQPGSNMD